MLIKRASDTCLWYTKHSALLYQCGKAMYGASKNGDFIIHTDTLNVQVISGLIGGEPGVDGPTSTPKKIADVCSRILSIPPSTSVTQPCGFAHMRKRTLDSPYIHIQIHTFPHKSLLRFYVQNVAEKRPAASTVGSGIAFDGSSANFAHSP